MQMKNNKGVTLVALIITVIVLGILLTITINYGMNDMNQMEDNKTETELTIVQQAVMQQYVLAKTKGELGKKAQPISIDAILSAEVSRPKTLVGTRLSTSQTLDNKGFRTHKISYDTTPESQSELLYENYYYELSSADLKELKIDEDAESVYSKDHRYIVNYSTGEVFDIQNRLYKEYEGNGDFFVYTPGTDDKIDTPSYDFNDE